MKILKNLSTYSHLNLIKLHFRVIFSKAKKESEDKYWLIKTKELVKYILIKLIDSMISSMNNNTHLMFKMIKFIIN